MGSKKSHLFCCKEISKCHRTHQDQAEHGDNEFEGETDSKMNRGFRKYFHTPWKIFLANKTNDSEWIEYFLFIVYRHRLRSIPFWLKRFIDAIGFFRHVFPGDFIGPCPATPADLSELAPSTFPLIPVGISKVLEDIGFFPNFPEMFFPDITTIQL